MWTYNETRYPDFIEHHGIRGQRWGRRRYQDSEGHYTAEGRERYGIGDGMPYHNLNYKPMPNSPRAQAREDMRRNESPVSRIERRRQERSERIIAERVAKQNRQTMLTDSMQTRREKVVASGKGTGRILAETTLKAVGSKLAYDIAGAVFINHGMSEAGHLLSLYGSVLGGAIALNGALDATSRLI